MTDKVKVNLKERNLGQGSLIRTGPEFKKEIGMFVYIG